MDEEFDLRPLVEALAIRWYWLISAAVLSALVAFGVSSVIAPTYEATALLVVTEPRQIVQFDPRFETVDETPSLQVYPELALSDDLVASLHLEIADQLQANVSVEGLRNSLQAKAGADPSLIRLTASSDDPNVATETVNQWAKLFVARANELYGDQGGGQLDFFVTQLEKAQADLDATEEALILYQAGNRANIVGNQLSDLLQRQSRYLTSQQNIVFLIEDVAAFAGLLVANSSNDEAQFSDQVTLLLMEMKAFNVDSSNAAQLQVGTEAALPTQSRSEQITFLTQLEVSLVARAQLIEAAMEALEPEILALQQEKQSLDASFSQVSTAYAVAVETYSALAQKVEEERITAQDGSSGVQLASNALVPETPVSPNPLMNGIIAAVLGAVLAGLFIFVDAWWR